MPRSSTRTPRIPTARTTKAAEAGYAALVAYGKEEESLVGRSQGEDSRHGSRQLIASSRKHSRRIRRAPQVLTRAATDLYAAKDYHARHRGCADAARPSTAGGRGQAAHRLYRDRQLELRAGPFRQGGSGLCERSGADAGERSGARRRSSSGSPPRSTSRASRRTSRATAQARWRISCASRSRRPPRKCAPMRISTRARCSSRRSNGIGPSSCSRTSAAISRKARCSKT